MSVTKKERIQFQDYQVDSWIAIIIDPCQDQLDRIDKRIGQLENEKESTPGSEQQEDFYEKETQRLKQAKHDIGDLYYELLELDTFEQKRTDSHTITERDILLLNFARKWLFPDPPIPTGKEPTN